MSQTLEQSAAVAAFSEQFERLRNERAEHEPAWLTESRAAGIAAFEKHGIPHGREEHWRHTSLANLRETTFKTVERTAEPAFIREAIERYGFGDAVSALLVFVNGRYAGEYSRCRPGQLGLQVMTLREGLEQHAELLREHLFRVARHEPSAFHLLNQGLFSDGAAIIVRREKAVERPVQIMSIQTQSSTPVATHLRNLIVLEESAELSVIETFVGADNSPYFTNAVTEAVLAENASLRASKVNREGRQSMHLATISAYQARDSRFASEAVTLGSALARNDIQTVLDGEGCTATMNGLYLPLAGQLHDTHTRIEHARPHCQSHELYKGILDANSAGVFNGRIVVHEDAQKTDAIQSNQALLLSETATINAQPQLEIFADDVRCTHGATVGALDADAVYYLRSRGIGEREARGLLTYAFANEVIETFSFQPLRKRLEKLIADRFRAAGLASGDD